MAPGLPAVRSIVGAQQMIKQQTVVEQDRSEGKPPKEAEAGRAGPGYSVPDGRRSTLHRDLGDVESGSASVGCPQERSQMQMKIWVCDSWPRLR